MNALVRQITVLSALWAVCELILPEGKHQQMVRMTASLLVMAALLSTVSGWFGLEQPAQPAMTLRVQQASQEAYQRTALTALANQTERFCTKVAQRAGYQAETSVFLTMEGVLECIELTLKPSGTMLADPQELAALLAEQLRTDPGRIQVTLEEP